MKFYNYALIVLITLGFTLAGCTQQRTDEPAPKETLAPKENLSANRNNTTVEVPKASPEPAAAEQKETNGEKLQEVTVYKSPTCGCCTMWESHMKKAGFRVTSKPTDKMAEIRKQYQVPDKMQSCHTAVVDGYVIEGHVPADDVKKLLKARPAAVVGLAAPGMPQKSPGMQPEGEKPAGYDVFSFDKKGNTKVFASY
jgi:hypothetical protein